MRILVIDDEAPTLKMFSLLLGAYGHKVFTADSGEAGLVRFKAHQPPLVLTDIRMPGMDGMEVLRQIKKLAPATEVIVITGHGDMDLALQALNLDATDFINKPIRREALDQALVRAEERLQLRSQQAEELTLTENCEASVITLRGTLGTSAEAAIHNIFQTAEKRGHAIILDFASSTSINGAAITILAECIRNTALGGIPVTISGLSESFRNVFEAMGVLAHVAVCDTLHSAMDHAD
ncbi:response regulator [Oleidesulfovibrio sp.]|uniref:response regulator n=1 Tax=Oleidesulfovibrio sp. TaxID=2909707 RepID=UPI003A89C2A8